MGWESRIAFHLSNYTAYITCHFRTFSTSKCFYPTCFCAFIYLFFPTCRQARLKSLSMKLSLNEVSRKIVRDKKFFLFCEVKGFCFCFCCSGKAFNFSLLFSVSPVTLYTCHNRVREVVSSLWMSEWKFWLYIFFKWCPKLCAL